MNDKPHKEHPPHEVDWRPAQAIVAGILLVLVLVFLVPMVW